RGENFAGRTNVDVLLLVKAEVFPTEGPVFALRFVDHRDMRHYLRLVDQPIQVGSGTVGGVAREPLRLDVEALLGAFDHGLGRANFGLADSARRLDVHDDAELHVNQILASATIKLASTAKPSPPTRPALMHAPTTRSNTLRKMSLLRNRSLRARENAE